MNGCPTKTPKPAKPFVQAFGIEQLLELCSDDGGAAGAFHRAGSTLLANALCTSTLQRIEMDRYEMPQKEIVIPIFLLVM